MRPTALMIFAACASCISDPHPPPHDRTGPEHSPRTQPADPVLARTTALLRAGDVAGAAALLERERWIAADRARAALLLCGCRLAQGDYARAMDTLREYLGKTTRVRSARDTIALRLLRHHASGGGLRAESAEEACYFGLYALRALDEPETARPDLEWALRDAPEPERDLVEATWRS